MARPKLGRFHSVRLNKKLHQNNILSRMGESEFNTRVESLRDVKAVRLSDISGDLGSITSGEFIAPADTSTAANPTDTGFTGAAMGGNGWTFDGTIYQFVAVLLGVLQVGFNNLGQFLAAGGEYTIDSTGTLSDGLSFLHRFTATYGGVTRQAYFGMTVPDGESQPSFRIYYNEPAASNLVLNGSFESGDETSWTDTNTSWSVVADSTYTYAAQHDNTDTGCPPTLTQDIAISASTTYAFQFYSKLTSGDYPAAVSLIWKDGGASVLRTDTIIGGSGTSWTYKGGVYTSPATAATVTISVHSGEIFSDCSVTAFELYLLTSYSSMDFYDSKIKIDSIPSKPVNLFGLPESATVFAQEAVWSASGAASSYQLGQRFATYKAASAANSADGDTVDFSFAIKAGTYTLTILGLKDSDAGKTDGYIDGATSTSWTGDDWYAASATANSTFTHSVTFTVGGRHTVRLKVNGKNAASSDYRTFLTAIYLTPSAVSVEA